MIAFDFLPCGTDFVAASRGVAFARLPDIADVGLSLGDAVFAGGGEIGVVGCEVGQEAWAAEFVQSGGATLGMVVAVASRGVAWRWGGDAARDQVLLRVCG